MEFLKINLCLFGEGGEGAATAGAESGVSDAPTSNEMGEGADPTAEEDRQSQYAKFKNDFKAEYDAEVQGLIKDRLKRSSKENAELNGKLKASAPILEAMAKKYGVDASDYNAILNAFEADDQNLEEEAYRRDMSVEQLRQFKQIERENQALRDAEAERKRQEIYAKWDREAEELKSFYPNFDVGTEFSNNDFVRLIEAGVDMRSAYEVTHRDEILGGAMKYTAQKTAEKVANSVRANAARATENGLSSNSASVNSFDIGKLSRAQMEEYKQRALNGERIDLKKIF
jgi:hypothetical protein